MTPVLLLLVSLLLVVACGVFVAAEFALVTVDRNAVDRAAEAGQPGAVGIRKALRTLSTQLSGAQVGITITNLVIGFLAEPAIASLVDDPLLRIGVPPAAVPGVALGIGLAIGTVLTMVFGELVPKNLALALPMQTARATQRFQRAFTTAMAWPIRFLNGSANAIVRRLGIQPQEELRSARSSTELASLISRSADQGTLDPGTAELMERSVSFGTRTAGEIMTPRVRTVTVEPGDRASRVIELARETGHSRFPVLDADDTVLGTVHVKHAVAVPVPDRATTRVKHIMVRPIVVPDSLRLDPLLALLRADGFQMAVVLDEYGGQAGVVTLEDVVEEIVGDISDEHDTLGEQARRLPEGGWVLSGLLRPDEVEDLTGVMLPEHEDYDTIAGLVMRELGRVARNGDVVSVAIRRHEPGEDDPGTGVAVLTVQGMDGLRIDRVLLRVPAAGDPGTPVVERVETPGTSMGSGAAIALAVVLLAANAFFVGAEFALISARRSQVEPRAQAGSRLARTTLRAMEDVSLMMAGAQLGITICSLALGAVGEPALAHLLEPVLHALRVPDGLLHPVAFAVALGIVVVLHVVLGEMVPKNIALAGPDRAALALGPPLLGIVTLLRPVIAGLNALTNLILRTLGVEPRDELSSTYTREEVAALVEESRGEGLLAPEEYTRLAGALGFTEKSVAAVVLPLASVRTIPGDATVAEVERLSARTGFSRFPVTEAGRMVGYVHLKDVLVSDDAHRHEPIERQWVRAMAVVGIGDQLRDALATLQRSGAHLARVVNAEGADVGLATLEDVLEELVGVIRDAAHPDDAA